METVAEYPKIQISRQFSALVVRKVKQLDLACKIVLDDFTMRIGRGHMPPLVWRIVLKAVDA